MYIFCRKSSSFQTNLLNYHKHVRGFFYLNLWVNLGGEMVTSRRIVSHIFKHFSELS